MTTRDVTTIVVGGGHSGLAMSRCLADRAIDHVVLERGSVANSWKTERWDSLTLLTPNWQSRLPGFQYDGDDPDGYMHGQEVASFIESFAASIDAPVTTGTTVTSVRAADGGYVVDTDQGSWRSRTVTLASGACNLATVPAFASTVPAGVASLTPTDYKHPGQLDDGGVLVVGASATGLQLADEIHRSGRPVILSAGEHVRMPRLHRGKDIFWWMDATGLFDERYDGVDDIVRVRNVPSPQLVGTPQRSTLDLNTLRAIGVEIRGRLGTIRDGTALFSGGLRNQCMLADLKMHRLLNAIDEWALEHGYGAADPQERPPATVVDDVPLTLDLTSGQIRTIVWATGFRPDYSWLDIPV
ncbi:MAG: putative flavoprotein involved in transport, partial [Acidimicrobiaceae bacterium]|nr:putative flavoprotein involved in transport [Acidimicrobiaceae bacterium]